MDPLNARTTPQLDRGKSIAAQAIAADRPNIDSLSYEEQVQWFAGFLASAAGSAGAALGAETIKLLLEEIAGITESVGKARQQ